MKSNEEKGYQLTNEEKVVSTSPLHTITTGEDMISDQNEKRTATTDLPSSSNTSPRHTECKIPYALYDKNFC